METIYLISRETDTVLNTYADVTFWNESMVQTEHKGSISRYYCDINTEFFSNTTEKPQEEPDELQAALVKIDELETQLDTICDILGLKEE